MERVREEKKKKRRRQTKNRDTGQEIRNPKGQEEASQEPRGRERRTKRRLRQHMAKMLFYVEKRGWGKVSEV